MAKKAKKTYPYVEPFGPDSWAVDLSPDDQEVVEYDRKEKAFICSCLGDSRKGGCPHIDALRQWGKAQKQNDKNGKAEKETKPEPASKPDQKQAKPTKKETEKKPARKPKGQPKEAVAEGPPTQEETVQPPSNAPVDDSGLAVLPHYPRDMEDIKRLAEIVYHAGLVKDKRANKAEAIAKAIIQIMAGLEMGIPPARAINEISVFSGGYVVSAQLMAYLARKEGINYSVRVLNAEQCTLHFYDGDKFIGKYTFSMEMARRAGLTNRNPNYQKYPESMLFARCLSAGLRTHAGGRFALRLYTPEEVADLVDVEDVPNPPAVRVVHVNEDGEVVTEYDAPAKPKQKKPKGNGDDKPITDAQRKAIHAMGRKIFTDQWDKYRRTLVHMATLGETNSLKDVSAQTASEIIDWLKENGNEARKELDQYEIQAMIEFIGATLSEIEEEE